MTHIEVERDVFNKRRTSFLLRGPVPGLSRCFTACLGRAYGSGFRDLLGLGDAYLGCRV